jgi:hypothetical protein
MLKKVYCLVENVPFETEHIIPISRGGTNRISNLTIACHKCNQEKGNMMAAEFGHPEVQIMAKKSLKAATFMNIVRSRLVDNIKENFPQYQCNSTYGYVTKHDRIKLGMEKTHANDAFVIANGRNQIRSKPYQVKQIRRNDRSKLDKCKIDKKDKIKKLSKKEQKAIFMKKQISIDDGWN